MSKTIGELGSINPLTPQQKLDALVAAQVGTGGTANTYNISIDAIKDLVIANIDADSISPDAINENATNRFVTDTEKTTWNAKQDALGFTPENVVNKQNTLTVDGTGVKFPTVDAVIAGLATKENAFSKGSFIAGTNITLGGAIANRLVGTGDITINATVSGGGSGIQLNTTNNAVNSNETRVNLTTTSLGSFSFYRNSSDFSPILSISTNSIFLNVPSQNESGLFILGDSFLFTQGITATNTLEVSPLIFSESGGFARRLQLNSGNGNSVSLKAPDTAITASYTLTLPSTAGSNNQVLTTDGSGGLSWSTVSGGGSGITLNEDARTPGYTGSNLSTTNTGTCIIASTNAGGFFSIKHSLSIPYESFSMASNFTALSFPDGIGSYFIIDSTGYSFGQNGVADPLPVKLLSDNSKARELQFKAGAGGNTVSLKASDTAITTSYTMVLPDTIPTVGQNLQVSNVSGTTVTLSFV